MGQSLSLQISCMPCTPRDPKDPPEVNVDGKTEKEFGAARWKVRWGNTSLILDAGRGGCTRNGLVWCLVPCPLGSPHPVVRIQLSGDKVRIGEAEEFAAENADDLNDLWSTDGLDRWDLWSASEKGVGRCTNWRPGVEEWSDKAGSIAGVVQGVIPGAVHRGNSAKFHPIEFALVPTGVQDEYTIRFRRRYRRYRGGPTGVVNGPLGMSLAVPDDSDLIIEATMQPSGANLLAERKKSKRHTTRWRIDAVCGARASADDPLSAAPEELLRAWNCELVEPFIRAMRNVTDRAGVSFLPRFHAPEPQPANAGSSPLQRVCVSHFAEQDLSGWRGSFGSELPTHAPYSVERGKAREIEPPKVLSRTAWLVDRIQLRAEFPGLVTHLGEDFEAFCELGPYQRGGESAATDPRAADHLQFDPEQAGLPRIMPTPTPAGSRDKDSPEQDNPQWPLGQWDGCIFGLAPRVSNTHSAVGVRLGSMDVSLSGHISKAGDGGKKWSFVSGGEDFGSKQPGGRHDVKPAPGVGDRDTRSDDLYDRWRRGLALSAKERAELQELRWLRYSTQSSLALDVISFDPGGRDESSRESESPAAEESPLLVIAEHGRGRANDMYLRVNESSGDALSHSWRATVFGTWPTAAADSGGAPGRWLIIDTQPMQVACLLRWGRVGLREKASPGTALARWSAGRSGLGRWELIGADSFTLLLPPQGVGEAMEKGRKEDGFDDITQNGRVDFRFSPPARLELSRSDGLKEHAAAPWDLRAVFAVDSAQNQSPALKMARFELLYGMECEVADPTLRVAEVMARVGRVVRPAQVTLFKIEWPPSLQDEMGPAANLQKVWGGYEMPTWGRLATLAETRLAVLEVFHAQERREPAGGSVLVEGVKFRVRHCNDPAIRRNAPEYEAWIRSLRKGPGSHEESEVAIAQLALQTGIAADLRSPMPTVGPRAAVADSARRLVRPSLESRFAPSDEGLAGGVTWGFESAAVCDELIRLPLSVSGEVKRPYFSALGGWGEQRALFAGGLTIIESTTEMGRLSRYRVSRLGRIGVLWNQAKHVVVYERTTLTSKQMLDGDSQDSHDGRPILRKTQEYVEILEPKRRYPENRAPNARQPRGFVLGCDFGDGESLRIPVDSRWGRDYEDGWEIPLWRTDAPPSSYPKPQIWLTLACDPAEGGERPARIAEPEKVRFWTQVAKDEAEAKQESYRDTNLWKPHVDIDYCNCALTLGEDGNPEYGDGPVPEPTLVPPGAEAFTWAIDAASLPTNLCEGRHPDAVFTRVRNVTMMRAEPAHGSLPEEATSIYRALGGLSNATAEAANGLAILIQSDRAGAAESVPQAISLVKSLKVAAVRVANDLPTNAAAIEAALREPMKQAQGRLDALATGLTQRAKDWAAKTGADVAKIADPTKNVGDAAQALADQANRQWNGVRDRINKLRSAGGNEWDNAAREAGELVASHITRMERGSANLLATISIALRPPATLASTLAEGAGRLASKIEAAVAQIQRELARLLTALEALPNPLGDVGKSQQVRRLLADARAIAAAAADSVEARLSQVRGFAADAMKELAGMAEAVSRALDSASAAWSDVIGRVQSALARVVEGDDSIRESAMKSLLEAVQEIRSLAIALGDEVSAGASWRVFTRLEDSAELRIPADLGSHSVRIVQDRVKALQEAQAQLSTLLNSGSDAAREALALVGKQAAAYADNAAVAAAAEVRAAFEQALREVTAVTADIRGLSNEVPSKLAEKVDELERQSRAISKWLAEIEPGLKKESANDLAQLAKAAERVGQRATGEAADVMKRVGELADIARTEIKNLDEAVKKAKQEVADALSLAGSVCRELQRELWKEHRTILGGLGAAGNLSTLEAKVREALRSLERLSVGDSNLVKDIGWGDVSTLVRKDFSDKLKGEINSLHDNGKRVTIAIQQAVANRKDQMDRLAKFGVRVFQEADEAAKLAERWLAPTFDGWRGDLDRKANALVDQAERVLKEQGRVQIANVSNLAANLSSELTRTVASAAQGAAQTAAKAAKTELQKASPMLGLLRAVGDPPRVPGLDFDLSRMEFKFPFAKPEIDITPVKAWVNRAAQGLKGMAAGLPTKELLDRFKPDADWLPKLDVSKFMPDLAGLKLGGLFPDLKMPKDVSDKLKVTQKVDPKARRASVTAELTVPFSETVPLFPGSVISVVMRKPRLHAVTQIEIVGDQVTRRTEGELSGDWALLVAGKEFATFVNTRLMFTDPGKPRLDLNPKNLKLAGLVGFLSDAISKGMGGGGDEEDEENPKGLTVRRIEKDGIIHGVEARLNLAVPDVQGGVAGISGLALGARIGLECEPNPDGFDFKIGVGFNLARKAAPFTITAFILGGAGYLEIDSWYSPITKKSFVSLELGIFASASIAFSLGPVSGGIYAYLGITASYKGGSENPGGLTFSAVFILKGEVDVCGIVSVTIMVMLELIYAADKSLTARGTLYIRIKLGWFFKITIRKSISWKSGGKRDGANTLGPAERDARRLAALSRASSYYGMFA